jgi:hypothetical protein
VWGFSHIIKLFPKVISQVVYITHTTSISNFSGEVKDYRITPIRHNPIYQTLFLGYPDMPDSPDIQEIRFDTMSNISDQIGLIWTISIQDDGLIPSQNRLRRLLNGIW